jgi:hypothetical protein
MLQKAVDFFDEFAYDIGIAAGEILLFCKRSVCACSVKKFWFAASPVCTTSRLPTSFRKPMSSIAAFGWNPAAVR